jgi:hypothetical protein
MKLAFAAALIATAQAAWGGKGLGVAGPAIGGHGLAGGYGGYGGAAYGKKGHYAKVSYTPVTKVVQPAAAQDAASVGKASTYQTQKTSDWDAWGRDQDLAIDESYGKTTAKSYTAESYDEWDNADDDKWGAQAWGKDRDLSGASSYERDASTGVKSAPPKLATDKADWEGGAAMSGYDNDEWAKQAYGSDYDSRWGKSYDSVAARSYDNEHYAREVRADDDQWAEDYDTTWAGKADAYGNAASAQASKGGHGWGKAQTTKKAASAGAGREYWGGDKSDWDAYGRDQDFHEKVSYDTTMAKSYSAESYDEWDNTDADKWGAQAWGKDNDIQGASSYGRNASSQKDTGKKYGYAGAYGAAGQKGYGGQQAYGAKGGYAAGGKSGWGKAPAAKGGYGGYGAQGYAGAQGAYGAKQAYNKGAESSHWGGASAGQNASKAAYDNDAFAKQAYGSDSDTRWGKSYDSVSARSYQNEKYARWLQADDDQWAEDYDAYENDDSGAYGKAASYWGPGQKGWGKAKGGEFDAASQAGQAGHWGKTGSDWDAYGRDQDLEVDESYEATWAKSYDAESYDEWDNADADKWGAQAWGKDRDIFGASSIGLRASEQDQNKGAYAYGAAGGAYGKAGSKGYGGQAYGAKGGKSGWGSAGYGAAGAGAYGAAGAKAYGGYQGTQVTKEKSYKDGTASQAHMASAMGYDNDEWAKQAYGRDMDTRWGKSYDFVDANSYDDEQYARKVRADDDQWAEDYDRRTSQDNMAYGAAASTEARQPQIKKTTYKPHVQYGSYGSYGGYGAGYGGAVGVAAKGKGGYAW